MLMSFALYLHLLALLTAAGASAVAHYLHARQRRATTAEEALDHAALLKSTARAFPIASLVLLLSGLYMAWRLSILSSGWIWVAVVGLVLIGAVGDGIVGRHQREAAQELGRNGMSARARQLLDDPIGRTAPVAVDTLVLGVVWIMVTEPSTFEAVLTLVVAILVGVGVPLALFRRQPAASVAG